MLSAFLSQKKLDSDPYPHPYLLFLDLPTALQSCFFKESLMKKKVRDRPQLQNSQKEKQERWKAQEEARNCRRKCIK
jgi:hypothetical protein